MFTKLFLNSNKMECLVEYSVFSNLPFNSLPILFKFSHYTANYVL